MHEGIDHTVGQLLGRQGVGFGWGSSTEDGVGVLAAEGQFGALARWVMTLPLFISEPVAGSVSTAPNGMARCTLRPNFSRMAQGSSPSNSTAAAMNLVASITEPPPTASRKSNPPSRICATACMEVS